ncbi:TonB-dependent receptor [Chitinophaga lutea]
MRLTMFLIALACMKTSAATYAQTISASLDKAPIEQVFRTVKQQTGYLFFYDRELLKATQPVTITANQAPLEDFLRDVFRSQPLDYSIKDKTIFLKRKPVTVAPTAPAAGPVTGTVKDANGLALIGVTIKRKNSTVGTVTDAAGRFLIIADETDVLVVSYIGYMTKEVKVTGNVMNIVLDPASSALDEAVVIGYGTAVRRSNTGSVSTVQSKDIGGQPVLDPLAALQGRVSGLMVTSSNGLPGSSFKVMLRGQNSIEGFNDPLYVVDGVPYFSEPLNQINSANGQQSPLASINPGDIERIDVLKDADATAIYGSRGANGVIVITTRKGSAGKTQVDVSVAGGGSKVVNTVDMMTTQEYVTIRKEAFANDNKTPDATSAPDLLVWPQDKTTDWQDLLIGNTAKFTNAKVSLSGGTEQTRYLFSGSYDNQTTAFPNSQPFKRVGGMLNLNHTDKSGKFNINASVNYNAIRDRSLVGDLTYFFNTPPNAPIYNANGTYYWLNSSYLNPMATQERTSDTRTNALFANATARYTILPGLDAKVQMGYQRSDMGQKQTFPMKGQNPFTTTGSNAYFGNSSNFTWIVEPHVEYTRNIAKGKLVAMAGATWQEKTAEGYSVLAENFSSDALLNDIKSAGKLTPRSSTYGFYRFTSGFGRITYNWDEKYIVNGSFRRDGSTRFAPGKRFGNFGAIGAAWIFTREDFMPQGNVLSFGKLRGSWGITGSDGVGDYQYMQSWTSTPYPYDGISGLTPSRVANDLFQWEETRKLEAGLELGFFKDRLLFNTNWYKNRSSNNLVLFPLSGQTGFPGYTANMPALVDNTGWEFDITSTNIDRGGFRWTTNFNVAFNKNELKEFPGIEATSYKERYIVGKSLSIVRGYQFTGVDPETGVAQFKDLDGSGGISEFSDYVVLGKTLPDFFGGLQNNLRYKGWELDFHFQFVKQEGPLLNYGYQSFPAGTGSNKDRSALDRWQKKGDITNVPKSTTLANNVAYDFYRLSSYMWGDASFIRLKNLSIRYNLSSLLQRYKVNNVSVYLSGQNLLTITNYDGFDPETQGYLMPPMKTITAGLSLRL